MIRVRVARSISTGSPAPISTSDAPLPLWALCVLAAGLLATASKPAARTHSAQSGSGASLVLMGAGLPVEIERATRTLIIPWLNGLRDLEALLELLESDAQMHTSQ